jgi:hypothetical protein
MLVDRKLNMVFPVDCDGGPYYVHSMPIGRETFERYHLVIAKVFTQFYAAKINVVAAPKVAALMLKDAAVRMGIWDDAPTGELGVGRGLMGEIRRLSNVVMPTATGWGTIPLEEAISRNLLTPDDLAEVEGAIVYFTVASSMHRKADLSGIMIGVDSLWGTKTSRSTLSEFSGSLPTSTETDPSEIAAGLSVPS